jgi:hypothetical protein|tara:strand:- start:274 stop:1080 length:807 start_codon:yes stop_codon:yes gene_type:complete
METLPNVLSLGAGVQSSTLALMAAQGEITPMPDCAVFADTQGEPKAVYDWLDWLEKQLPFPVYRVTRGSLEEYSTTVKPNKNGRLYCKGGVPVYPKGGGLLPRHCTSNFKIQPIYKFLKERFNVPKRCKEVRIKQWIGISIDEVHRMKPSRKPWIANVYPLVDERISRAHCLEWWKKNNMPQPPRSACVFCPYHSDSEWKEMKNGDRESWDAAVKYEKRMQIAYQQADSLKTRDFYIHNQCVPLEEVVFKDQYQADLFGNECEGMCGV